ncbi:hypothetical protein [Acidovorax sp. Leaf160]|uniref:hypothetical protein n=1 Tax=Acidovorax sp. Leaf160 TaxID=1736280 RepID=UPI000A49CA73|nr:hypothetical protein [Acidovorax sp. Leaf160]
MAKVETSRMFALALAEALGLQTDRLMSFSVDAGGETGSPVVLIRAVYVAPRGAGEAAATHVRSFNLIPGPQTCQEGENVDRSESLKTGFETIHRPASPALPRQADTTAQTPATPPSHCGGCECGTPS